MDSDDHTDYVYQVSTPGASSHWRSPWHREETEVACRRILKRHSTGSRNESRPVIRARCDALRVRPCVKSLLCVHLPVMAGVVQAICGPPALRDGVLELGA